MVAEKYLVSTRVERHGGDLAPLNDTKVALSSSAHPYAQNEVGAMSSSECHSKRSKDSEQAILSFGKGITMAPYGNSYKHDSAKSSRRGKSPADGESVLDMQLSKSSQQVASTSVLDQHISSIRIENLQRPSQGVQKKQNLKDIAERLIERFTIRHLQGILADIRRDALKQKKYRKIL